MGLMGRRMQPRRGTRRGGHRHPVRPWRRPPRKPEDGFTLIELLIVLVILPLVTGAIAMVLITTLKNQQGIQGKVTDSAAAASSSEFYTRDVQSAGEVTTKQTPASAPQNCPLVGATGTSTFLLG